jgi:hypothetical protein
MQLPVQRASVERTNASQPLAHRGASARSDDGNDATQGVGPSEYGVGASDINWGSVLSKVLPFAIGLL